MTVLFSPWGNQQFFDENGDPATGWKIYSYAAGSSTTLATYTTSDGGVAQSNPVVLDALGFATGGQIWLTSGLAYKLVLTNASGVVKKTQDNVTGVTGTSSASQWQASGLTPTYVNATSFTLPGDQTSAFHIGRRVQSTNTSGTIYSRISDSAYTTLTTVTVVNDSGVLDSGLSVVNYGLLTFVNPSIPEKAVGNAIRTAANEAAARDALLIPAASRHFFSGFTLSTAGSSTTMSIAAGAAVDSTFVTSLIGAAIAKTTSNWSVGTAAGGKSLAAAIANSTKYYFYVIRRPDTGVVDVAFSTNSTGLLAADYVAGGGNIPDAYTQFRYIGMGLTNGSAQWTKFLQLGRTFWWDVPTLDANGVASTGSSTNYTMNVPLGRRVEAKLNVSIGVTAGGIGVYVHCPDITSAAPALTAAPIGAPIADDSGGTGGQVVCLTNTSGQVAARANASDTLRIVTLGYTDSVGIDS